MSHYLIHGCQQITSRLVWKLHGKRLQCHFANQRSVIQLLVLLLQTFLRAKLQPLESLSQLFPLLPKTTARDQASSLLPGKSVSPHRYRACVHSHTAPEHVCTDIFPSTSFTEHTLCLPGFRIILLSPHESVLQTMAIELSAGRIKRSSVLDSNRPSSKSKFLSDFRASNPNQTNHPRSFQSDIGAFFT